MTTVAENNREVITRMLGQSAGVDILAVNGSARSFYASRHRTVAAEGRIAKSAADTAYLAGQQLPTIAVVHSVHMGPEASHTGLASSVAKYAVDTVDVARLGVAG